MPALPSVFVGKVMMVRERTRQRESFLYAFTKVFKGTLDECQRRFDLTSQRYGVGLSVPAGGTVSGFHVPAGRQGPH